MTKKNLLTLLKVGFSVGLIVYLLSRADLAKIWAYVSSANIPLLILAFVLFYVGYFFSVNRLVIILKVIDIKARKTYLFRSYVIAMMFNNLLPSTIGGDAYRIYDVWRVSNDKPKSVASILLDRFFGMTALVLIGLVGTFWGSEITAAIPGLTLALGAIFLVMIFVIWTVFGRGIKIIDWFLGLDFPLIGIVQKMISKLVDAMLLLRGRKDIILPVLLYSLLIQVNVVIHFIIIAEALSITIPWQSMFVIIPLSGLILLLPISINGVGLREGIFVFLFGLYGVNEELALAFSFVALGMLLLQGIVGAIVFLFRNKETRSPVGIAEDV